MDSYDPARDMTEAFVSKSTHWINQLGEVLVVLRYLRGGGAKDYLFCHCAAEFLALIESLPVGTDTIVFGEKHLPLRGVVSEEFIEKALTLIPDGKEYMIVRMIEWKAADYKKYTNHGITGITGDAHPSLREDLLDFFGEAVAIGLCPVFWGPDHVLMISASKGGIDGPR